MDTMTMIHTLITRGDYEALRGSHETLRLAAISIDDTDKSLFLFLLDYAALYGKYPTYPELEQFVLTSHHVDDKTNRDMLAMRCNELRESSDKLDVHQGGVLQLLDDYTYVGRQAHCVRGLKQAMNIVTGAVQANSFKKGERDLSGPDDAVEYFAKHAAKDFSLPAAAPEGAWTDNSELSADTLIDGLKDTIRERCYTGFRHIDNSLTIGPKQSIKYIGLLGFLNHGKSMLLRSMAYSMAVSGKRILYIAREDSALNTWTQLSFLHSFKRPELHIPPVNVWRNQPHAVTVDHQDNLRLLVDDLQHGTSVPGEIVVKTCPTWAEIVRELEIGNNGKPYDVLAVDYLGHLKTGATGSKMHEEIRSVFKAAQGLCLDYKSGRGLVVITPLQSNKTGMKAADEGEGEDWGVYPDLGAIEQYTDAARDMDLIVGVWLKGDVKQRGLMKLSCLKSREDFFPPHLVQVDRRTRLVHDLPGTAVWDVGRVSSVIAEAVDKKITSAELAVY